MKKHWNPNILTTEEVEELFKIDRQLIYRLCQNGEMPHARIGRVYRFELEALKEWFANGGSDCLDY